MAKVVEFEAGTQNLKPHESEVVCYYQTVTTAEGSPLLHLSTFGSNDRASKPKSSQSLQLDRAAAAELLQILTGAFPDLAA